MPSGALAVLFLSSCFSAPQLSAQSSDSQQNSQDVAEAARQTRARKQQASGERHVYTNEDLHRSKILMPDDETRTAAAKEKLRTPAPGAPPEVQPLNANSATPQESLGDVARRFRNAKKVSPFHLPTNQPELASPKIAAPIPELALIDPSRPQPPARDFAIAKPIAPTARTASPAVPVFPTARAHRIDPFVGRHMAPLAPNKSFARSVAPTIAAPRATSPVRPAISSAPRTQVVVQPGDTLWTISRQHLGRGTRWLELMVANPNLPDPGRLAPGTVLALPAPSTVRRSTQGTNTVVVHVGDTLSKLALDAYGRASYWSCIAAANPVLSNPDRLAVGQVLSLPSSCKP
ncbi:MAG: hypothetical protein NVS9B14_11530 [Candidatus Acidiferrum sp.]